MRQGSSHPKISGDFVHFEGIKQAAAAWISYHGMLGPSEIVVIFQVIEIGDVLELAVAKRRLFFERPVAVRVGSRAAGKPNQDGGNALSRQRIEIGRAHV